MLCTSQSSSALYGDYFSTHLSQLVSQMRVAFSIQLEAIPPYMHHLNPYAEGLMRILKTGCIRRLPALVGKTIHNKIVKEPREYWPFAMEHKVQSYTHIRTGTVHVPPRHDACTRPGLMPHHSRGGLEHAGCQLKAPSPSMYVGRGSSSP